MGDAIAASFLELFGRPPEIVTSAPGRIEIIGNHTDYNGGPVLGASIDRSVRVAIALRSDGRRHFVSDFEGDGRQVVDLSADGLTRQSGKRAWTNYPLGVLAALPEFGLGSPGGFDYLAHSDLPVGSGLSSSAAIEIASALAFIGATEQHVAPEMFARIGRQAENSFVGVPCGMLDQGVSVFGRSRHLVFVDTPKRAFKTIPLPEDAHFLVFNTHKRHSLVDGLYSQRNHECMLAASGLGVSLLAEASAEHLDDSSGRLSEAIARRAKHVIDEIGRVHSVVAALRTGDLATVGQLLTASHRSSQRLFENSTEELDFLVDELSSAPHVYGARLTGGGFGGAVLAMTDADFAAKNVNDVAEAYLRRFAVKPTIIKIGIGRGARVLRSQ
jgi:galactokinase